MHKSILSTEILLCSVWSRVTIPFLDTFMILWQTAKMAK